MSSLLERAIIDAKALKEAALKNAENLVIEKYSEEVKSAVSTLLEQDDFPEDLGIGSEDEPEELDDPGMGEPADMLDTPDPIETATEDPEVDQDTAAAEEFRDSTVGQVPDAFSPDLGDPEDEIVDIKLDSLRADLPDEDEGGVFGGDDELSDEELSIDITDDEDDMDLGIDTDFGDDAELDASDTPDADIDTEFSADMIAEMLLDEIDLDEDLDLEDLEEAVRVDFEPQKSGWAGTPESLMREYEQMLLAREQDSKVKEENEELRKTVAALQKENKTLGTVATKLKAQIEKYTTTLETLQEKLETTNVSNAKLLYINRALENASLNERQKEKLVESISKATTVQEAKIIFDTLQETVTSSPAEKKMGSLSEAVSRRSTLLVGARNEQKEKAVNPAFNRLQRLAGIKTNK